MFAHLIHQFFDGTLSLEAQEHLLKTISDTPAAMQEYCHQQSLHEVVRMNKNAILAQSNADEDLAAIFARIEPDKNRILPLPILPTTEAQAPELDHTKTETAPFRQASFTFTNAPIVGAERNKRRRVLPLVGRMALQALCFCAVGAVVATFGVKPLGQGSTNPFKMVYAHRNTTHPNTESPEPTAHYPNGSSQAALIQSGVTNTRGGTPAFANGTLPVLVSGDSTQTQALAVLGTKNHLGLQATSEWRFELPQMCVFKGKKRIYADSSDVLPEGATLLAATKLPKIKPVQPLKEDFKPYLVFTSRFSSNFIPSGGYTASVGAMYAVTERDAFGVEIGGTSGRQGYTSDNSEVSQNLTPAGFVAGIYRFTLPIEGTKLAVFSHLRAGIETTGVFFGGVGFGAQYQVSDKFFIFASAEAARILWEAPEADQSTRLAHEGVSLGIAVKL